MSDLFKLHNVFSIDGSDVAVFQIFEDLETNFFHVQSCDFNISSQNPKEHIDSMFELFSEQLPNKRDAGYLTIQEAVEAHRRDFS